MPFAAADRPAVGISTLKGDLSAAGVHCDVVYLNLAFAALVGRDAYDRFVNVLPHGAMAGDWVFAESLHDRAPTDTFVDDILRARWRLDAQDVALVLQIRAAVPGFLRDALADLSWHDYAIVGFTSYVTQTVASLALARLVKTSHPTVTTVLGGANCRGRPGLELHRRFPFLDYVVSGEADRSFPELVRCLREGDRAGMERIPGLVYRGRDGSRANAEGEPVADLDSLPAPDFADFYAARHRLPAIRSSLPVLMAEASRGCWWASARPCSFCGIGARDRAYRAKSPERVVSELRAMTSVLASSSLQLTDEVVPPAFLNHVVPQLARERLPTRLFFEVRPTIDRTQLEWIGKLNAEIQPGIESFSDHVLQLMGKGTRGLENVRLLKWCKELGIRVHWNLLHGCPGEAQADYDDMLALLPAIRFLDPPDSCHAVTIDRDSVYHRAPGQHGLSDLHPLVSYEHLYPFPPDSLMELAVAFERTPPPRPDLARAAMALEREVVVWREQSRCGGLRLSHADGGRLELRDLRPGATERSIRLDPLESLLYAACRDICDVQELREAAAGLMLTDFAERGVDECLTSLVERRLMVASGTRFLSLAVTARA
jgi:ribosomal peptide maturation radical SAM protein 1